MEIISSIWKECYIKALPLNVQRLPNKESNVFCLGFISKFSERTKTEIKEWRAISMKA